MQKKLTLSPCHLVTLSPCHPFWSRYIGDSPINPALPRPGAGAHPGAAVWLAGDRTRAHWPAARPALQRRWTVRRREHPARGAGACAVAVAAPSRRRPVVDREQQSIAVLVRA